MSSVDEIPLILTQVQSGDNNIRLSAETRLYKDWLEAPGTRPAELLLGLAQIATTGDLQLRPSAAVIFRRCAVRASPTQGSLIRVFDTIDPQYQMQIRDLVLQGMLSLEQQPFTRHKLADAVAELARPGTASSGRTDWPGLLEIIGSAATSSTDASVRESAFRVLGTTPELIEVRDDMIRSAIELLLRGFEDPSEAVRTTATTAFSAFFAYFPKRTWAMFKPLLPVLLNVMEPFRQGHMETELTSVLESLITLAEIAPKMFQPVFSTLVEFCLVVARDTDFDENTRMSALELMITFAEESPNMCKKEQIYTLKMVPLVLKMMTEVGIDDDDGAEWQNSDDNMQIEEEEAIHSEAKLVMDRLSLSLGGEYVTPPLFEYLPQMLTSSEWRDRFGALMALSNAAEGCREEILPQLESILNVVAPLLQDPHPRVQWGACNAMGQLSTDMAPEIQENFGHVILPGLIAKLDTSSTFKVQAHAAAALVNFSDCATQDIMDPYLDSLLSRLLLLIQSPKRYVQEQALTTVAMVADSCQVLFTKYYDTLMPLVLNILTANVPAEYRLLKAKAIECSTLIALAVGKEKFLPHMNQLGQILVQIQAESQDGVIQTENGEEEDPCHSYLAQSWGRLCRVIGQDFVPYLDIVLPPLLKAARSQADCHLLDLDQAESLRDAEGWEVVKYSGQWLGIHTAAFEEKASAIEILHVYPRELGAAFYPYVAEILKDVVIPGIKFYYNIRVRIYTCQLVPHLIAAVQAHFQGVKDNAEVMQLWKLVLDTLINTTLKNEKEIPSMIGEAFMTIQRAIELIGITALQAEDLSLICQTLRDNTLSSKLRLEQAAMEKAKADADDENDEYEEDYEEEEHEDEELIDASNKLIHTMLKAYSAAGVDILNSPLKPTLELLPQFAQSISQDAQLWALEVLGDVAEFGKAAALPVVDALCPFVINSLAAAPLVRSAAAHCVGRIALNAGPSVSAWALQSLETLIALGKINNSRSEENVDATERACGSVARVLRTFGSALPADQFSLAVNEFINLLPVVTVPDGASYSYLFLAELIEKRHPAVLNAYPAAFNAVVKALNAGTLAGKPAAFVTGNLKTLVASLPEDKQLELFNGLTNSEKQVAQRAFA